MDGLGGKHFDNANCQLVTGITAMLNPVMSASQHCTIRSLCRWFPKGGWEACLCYPRMATEQRNSTEPQTAVAG